LTLWFFTSDLHGSLHRYQELVEAVARERPAVVLLGGDLLPASFSRWSTLSRWNDPETPSPSFLDGFLLPELRHLCTRMGSDYPRILLILGNDDLRIEESSFREAEEEGLWTLAHRKRLDVGDLQVFGYSLVPPTPFLWKDWERFDVSRYVPPGCVSPEEGWRTVEADPDDVRYGTIKEDLKELAGDADMAQAIFLFHTPPHETKLDRAALDGKMVDHVPLDLNVGSIAVRRFIETRQPLLTLHGHVHESPRITGSWRDRIGRTHLFSGAHDGPELALVRFDPGNLEEATRELI